MNTFISIIVASLLVLSLSACDFDVEGSIELTPEELDALGEIDLDSADIDVSVDGDDIEIEVEEDVDEDSDEVADIWETHTNTEAGFSVSHPNDWNASASQYGSTFGPVGAMDFLWSVHYSDEEGYAEEWIAGMGDQFDDRVESREVVRVNGMTAAKVTVTTPSVDDWVYVAVIFETDGGTYILTNGAILDFDFATFYESFELL